MHRWRRLRRNAATTVAGLSVLTVAACGGSSDDGEGGGGNAAYEVGVLVVAQSALLDDIVAAFEDSVEEGVGADVDFTVKNAAGDQSLISSISREFAGSGADAFAVVGTPAVIALAAQVKDRPIFALAMGDPVGAGLAKSLEAPGGNVTGSVDYVEPEALLDDLLAAQPDLAEIGTVYDPSNQNMQVWTAALKKAVSARPGMSLSEATISGAADVSQAARSLAGRADAVLVGPDALVIAGMDAVASAAAGAQVPVYVSGGDAATAGVLASIGPDYPSLGTSAGAAAAEVLQGADAATTPFAVPDSLDVVVNTATAEALGLTLPADFLAGATTL